MGNTQVERSSAVLDMCTASVETHIGYCCGSRKELLRKSFMHRKDYC